MYLYFILHVFCVGAHGESCTAPTGQMGECVPLKLCTSLFWPLANYKPANFEYIRKFRCYYSDLGLIVCCPKTNKYLVFEDEEDNYNPYDPHNVKLKNTEHCGITTNSEIPNGIIGLQDFPWLVKIAALNESIEGQRTETVACTGVLINSRNILFSAVCNYALIPNGVFFIIRADSFTNKELSCSDRSYSSKCSESNTYETDRVVVHPFYDPNTKINNIALMRLDRRVQFSDFIRPICLPISDNFFNPGEVLYTAGWNRTINKFSVKTSHTSVYVTNEDCEPLLPKTETNFSLSSYEMCSYTKTKTTHEETIGFPLMSMKDNRWYLQGFETQGNYTKVYSRIQNYLQWIENTIGSELCFLPYDNKLGECVHIGYCPKVLDALANVSPNDESVFLKFLCYPGDSSIYDKKYLLKVCCGLTLDFTTPSENTDMDLDFEISDFKYCGFQHRDDYFSTDDTIALDEFPWLAIILNATLPEQRDQKCGGSLITHRYVLTSGQCTYQLNLNNTVLVRLGDYDLKNTSNCVEFVQFGSLDCVDIQEYGVEKIITHPFYNRMTFYNDIALLRLNETVIFSNYVRPICVPRTQDDLAKPGETLFFTGFGNTDSQGKKQGAKKKIRTTLISNEDCQARFDELNYNTPVTQYQMCTVDYNNSSDIPCAGDEGGPIMHARKFQWFIEGISSSYGCELKYEPQNCLKVYKYLKWIKLNIKDD